MPKLRVIIKPPPEPTGDPAQDVEAQRDYLLQMSEELAYVLTHLEADNINDSTFERIQSMIPRPYTGLPVMDGDANPGQSEQWARGNHRHPHDTSKADVTALEAEAAAREAHEADTDNPHEVTKAQVGLGNVANERQYSAQNPPPIPTPGEVGAIPTTEKGSAGGVAELDSNGHVPSSQLPSYVDDVKEYPSVTDFPIPGESDKIYIALDTDLFYRWGGTVYAPTNPSLALGETSSTAYRGDRGKAAYDHSQLTSGNPHNVTAAQVGLGNVANERQYSALNPPPLPTPADIGAATAQDLTNHVGNTANPHGVTAAQAGARPDTWTPSAADVGARPDDWAPDAEDVPYDNTQSGLMATDVQAAIDELAQGGGGGGTAANAVSYDNTGSGLAAANVQDAIDEVVDDLDGKQPTIAASGILKGDGAGGVSAAAAGTDYATPDIGVYYGRCQTAATTAAKEVSITGVASYYAGLHIRVRFDYAQEATGTVTLNVNNLGALQLRRYNSGSATAVVGEWRGGTLLDIEYQDFGTPYWIIVNSPHATTDTYGRTILSSSTSSSDTDKAATPSAVKAAYDLADGKYTKPSGGIPASDLASGVIPTVPSASSANPQMDGTASPGSTGEWADGGHVHPRYTGAYAYETIFSTVTDIHTDTTITLDKNYADYKLLAITLNTRSADTSSYRMSLLISPLAVDVWGSYALANREANGYLRIAPVNNQPKQIRFALTDLTALYVTEIRGIY